MVGHVERGDTAAMEETDHVIVPDLPSRTGQEVLDVLRIPGTKMIPLSTLGIVEFEELVLTIYPGLTENTDSTGR
jgi:hypothetical protein